MNVKTFPKASLDRLIAGIDIGATKTRVGLYLHSGWDYYLLDNVVTFITSPFPETNTAYARDYLEALVGHAIGRPVVHGSDKIRAAGIGAPGVDIVGGKVRFGPSLSRMHGNWRGYDVAEGFRNMSDSVHVDSDSIGGGLGSCYLMGLGPEDFPAAYVSMGTGLGVALFLHLDGIVVPYRPKDKLALGWGHLYSRELDSMLLYRHPLIICKHDRNSCLETVFSGPAIQQRYQKDEEKLNDEEKHELAGWLVIGLKRIMDEGTSIGYTPKTFLIGGGAAQKLGLGFIDAVQKNSRELIVPYHLGMEVRRAKIMPAFDPRGPTIGAAILASEHSYYRNFRIVKR
jgi:predicted NBD/HSP70 family sugar kinase